MTLPQKHKIILGVTGGIAAYKSCELVRLLKKSGYEVRVILTKNAEKFVGALSFESLSGNPVLRDGESSYDMSATAHIDLAEWGDLLVVAPATANFIAKYTHGIADGPLLTEALAFQGQVFIAPAMNTRMWDASITQENIEKLKLRNVHFIGPDVGDLACGEFGAGKMSSPEEIFSKIEKILSGINSSDDSASLSLRGKNILITSGPTRSYIDSVRYITNRSSGRMGQAIASAAEKLGATVTLITGPVEPRFAQVKNGKVIHVETAEEMLSAAIENFALADIVFATAAVSDFKMPEVFQGKMPREGILKLELEAAADVIGTLAKLKKQNQVFFGFAAEAGEGSAEFAKARNKLSAKKLDFLALNNISRKDIGFDADSNEVYLFQTNGDVTKIEKNSKTNLAEQLVKIAAKKMGTV